MNSRYGIVWRFDAEFDAIRRDGDYRDAHLSGDDDRLVETPGENQHGRSSKSW
jgi:hypothetical protein